MAPLSTVAAVVVTYNRQAKVGETLDRILAQTRAPDWIIVVDNASTDGTDQVLASYCSDRRVIVYRLQRNMGGAGGFSAGMARGYELGADFVWLMDDDCYPRPDALEELETGLAKAEKAMAMPLSYACSQVKFVDGEICEMNNPGTTWDWGRLMALGHECILVTNCSFVSVLFPRRVLTRFGLPLKEYFIWFDDQEYTLRVTRAAPGVQCLRSVVVHDMGVNRGVNFADVSTENMFKFRYGVRNEASYRLHHQGVGAFVKFAVRLAQQLHAGHVAWPLRIQLLRKLIEGVTFNPKPEYPRSVL
ncbi:MAG TPA: glycosyltransferase family 2 protein [Pseudonocardiaceae bacterium]|nr:glycosyltransferase family 2 protein [Pseudonocardiaceae bacterium]